MKYQNGELNNKVITLMKGNVLVAKGRVIEGNQIGIFLDEVGFIKEDKGVKNSYSSIDLAKYRIILNN